MCDAMNARTMSVRGKMTLIMTARNFIRHHRLYTLTARPCIATEKQREGTVARRNHIITVRALARYTVGIVNRGIGRKTSVPRSRKSCGQFHVVTAIAAAATLHLLLAATIRGKSRNGRNK